MSKTKAVTIGLTFDYSRVGPKDLKKNEFKS